MHLVLLSLLLPAHAVTPLGGLAWTPLSRADLTWVEDDRTSGLGVGEYDGFVRPNLSAFGGAWLSERVGLVGSIGIARLQSNTWVGDVYRHRHWGVVRPALDLRVAIGPRLVGRPSAWTTLGVHGDIPSARDVSNGYTEDEQDTADENAYVERARLGGFGARLGLGVDYRITHGVALGGCYAVEWHRGTLRTDEATTLSSWLSADASILLTFEWPRAE